ncbi:hypothetical protein HS5_04620 [Acidianus sp. HS-5]|nr:hypothetical protein HS5_04620 [Acidianus sp. HS-5]
MWVVRIFSKGNDCIARYTSDSSRLAFNLPNGKYIYAVNSCNPLYVTSNAVDVLNVQGNADVSIHFVPAPWAGGPNGYHPYEPISGYQTVTLALCPTDGPEGLSFGAMNSTLEFCVYLGSTEIYSKVIVGHPFSLVSITPNNDYGYVNFNYSGQGMKLVVKNLGPSTGYYAYSLWDYYIDNYTASLITIPPQFAANFGPVNFNVNKNTGISFLVKAPNYTRAYPLTLWIGEGFYYPNGKGWWAQIGFGNWYNGSSGSFYISYPFLSAFSNIFPGIAISDTNYPLIPGDIYNFTMALISNTTWGVFINGTPIICPEFNGYFNATTTCSNGGFDLGFEVLTEARIGSENATCFISNPVTVIQGMEMKIGNQWVKVPNLGMGVIGENWWTIGTSYSPGMTLYSVQGNIQNSSIPPGELVFTKYNNLMMDIPVHCGYPTTYPVYGSFNYPDMTYNTKLNYFNATVSQGMLKITVNQNQTVLSIFSLNSQGILTSFKSYLFNKGVYYLPLPQNVSKLAISASSTQGIYCFNSVQSFGDYVEEISLDNMIPHQVTFVESGLPPGTLWSVTFDGQEESSSSPTITFSVPPGTYSYNISNVSGYAVSQPTGVVTVTTSNVIINISFTPLYSVTFKESGLPFGSAWSVTFNGTTKISTSNTITFVVSSGIYSYQVYSAYYTSLPSQGTIHVTSNETVQVDFAPKNFTITFVESGLPEGTVWSVCVNGIVRNSTTDKICFLLPYGHYEYKVFNVTEYGVTPYTGYVNLTHNVTLSVGFYVLRYNVTFREVGLPNGVIWYVCVNGTKYNSSMGYITLTLPVGIYVYRVFSAHYIPNVSEGTVNLTEKQLICLEFMPMNYTLILVESGLPKGYEWVVDINGANYTTVSGGFNITLPYGEYKVEVYSKYYVVSPEEEEITLCKNNEVVFKFVPENFTITFEETGLPSGVSWTVCINGRNYTTKSSSMSITMPYGNYSYRVFTTSNGYVPNITEGMLTLTKTEIISSTYKQIMTTSTTTTSTTTTSSIVTSPSNTKPQSNLGLVLSIVVIIIVIAAVAIFLIRKK